MEAALRVNRFELVNQLIEGEQIDNWFIKPCEKVCLIFDGCWLFGLLGALGAKVS